MLDSLAVLGLLLVGLGASGVVGYAALCNAAAGLDSVDRED